MSFLIKMAEETYRNVTIEDHSTQNLNNEHRYNEFTALANFNKPI